MKNKIIIIFVLLLLMMPFSVDAYKKDPNYQKARHSGAITRIIISATDDNGEPVSDVQINVLMGMNFRVNAYCIKGQTDKQGMFAVEGITTGNEIEIEALKDGYYKAYKKLCFAEMGNEYEVKDDKWQPWGMEISLPLRKRCNPIPLIWIYDGKDIPTTNQWFSFDMQKKDWVMPGHTGVTADFEVYLTWDGKPLPRTKQSDLIVRFIGEGAGYYFSDKTLDSKFKGVYHANTNATFKKELICKSFRGENGGLIRTGIPDNKFIVVRTRCKLDEKKNIIEANYSALVKIFAQGGWHGTANAFMYYLFNPTPNDTNLEAK